MSKPYDAIVVGSGLGGLTAAALLAQAGRKILIIERNASVGGAASTYRAGDLVIEGSLHETSDPRNPLDPKHQAFARLGILTALDWVPVGSLFEVRGDLIGAPFLLPDSFAAARTALGDRFPTARKGVAAVLGEMERVCAGLGTVMRGREAFRDPREGLSGMMKLWPMARHWQLSLDDMLQRHFGSDEAVKFALAANLAYYHDDPRALSWIFFAIAQGGYLQSGGHYIRGGSQKLSDALAGVVAAAGGEILPGRTATAIHLDRDGASRSVTHCDSRGGDEATAQAPIIVGNAAPQVLADMLPDAARMRFLAPYAAQSQSISLFSATFGLSIRGAQLGIRAYSTFLVPRWLKSLAQHRDSGAIMATLPAEDMPAIVMVDYSAVESGLGGPPYPVSVVGVDRIENWANLDKPAYERKRQRWSEAIVAVIDREFPGFASNIVATHFNTARSIARYLNAPQGAVYGFAPRPPSGPIWRGAKRSPKTAIPGLYLASAYAGTGGFTGSIVAGAAAADLIVARSQPASVKD